MAFVVDVPYVDVLSVVEESFQSISAALDQVLRSCQLNVAKVALAATEVIEFVINQSVIVCHLEVCWEAIILPVGESVSNNLALKVGYPSIRIDGLSLLNPVIKLVHQVRDEDTAIVAANDPERVVFKNGKLLLQKDQNSFQVILCG